MLDIFGFRLVDLQCAPQAIVDAQGHVLNPCLNPYAFGVNWSVPEVIFGKAGALFSGFSVLALISSLLQLVQSRMSLPMSSTAGADDPNTRIQRQMAYIFPFISIVYGSILPAGLFLYWITSTIFAIVQQYLIIGWGGTFPLFGWTPGFAREHKPRFPVTMPPPPDPSKQPPNQIKGGPTSRATSADKTIRPRERGRQGRRGRRR
jgi:60Kd inner membrane protein